MQKTEPLKDKLLTQLGKINEKYNNLAQKSKISTKEE